jgi:metal-responsive CopG/Arc/MetJ family transcriptional regulator
MKTAISLPDTLFERAERVAREMKLNRSQLYAQALEAYLDQLDPDAITAAFNDVYRAASATIEPGLWEMQLASLSELAEDEW